MLSPFSPTPFSSAKSCISNFWCWRSEMVFTPWSWNSSTPLPIPTVVNNGCYHHHHLHYFILAYYLTSIYIHISYLVVANKIWKSKISFQNLKRERFFWQKGQTSFRLFRSDMYRQENMVSSQLLVRSAVWHKFGKFTETGRYSSIGFGSY